ncbi:MAG: hypothetical protein SH820_18480 [Xanthomonadales bacterium]|nr:hypothetical protein [Xanthomonadales bacterium]
METGALPDIQNFVRKFSTERKWDASLVNRVQLAVEETMLALMEIRKADFNGRAGAPADRPSSNSTQELRLELRAAGELAELDMAVASIDSNMEELIDSAKAEASLNESQLPLRILANIAENVQHFQFHGLDFISLSIRGKPHLKNTRKLI